MKLSFSPEVAASLEWVEWTNRQLVTKAHCIDPTSEARTGKKRTVSGSVVPKTAVPAQDDTLRDEFSLNLVAAAQRKWKEDNEAPKKAPSEPQKGASQDAAPHPPGSGQKPATEP